MKQTRFIIMAISLAAVASSYGATILSVDFGGAAGPVQAGFVGQSAASATHSTTGGNITVAIGNAQSIQALNTNASTVEGYNMYNDGAFKNGSSMTLTLSGPGISASTEYSLTFWSCYNNGETRTTSFVATTGTTGTTLGPIATATTTPTGFDDPVYSATGTFTSDASGVLTFAINSALNRPLINGFRIASIPEPSIALLGGLGFLAMLRRRR
jgi:hypothetical protein